MTKCRLFGEVWHSLLKTVLIEKNDNFQVVKPLYTDSMKSWVGKIPDDVLDDMAKIAPMLSTLGYDPHSKDPFYGKPDQEVTDKYMKWLETQKDKK